MTFTEIKLAKTYRHTVLAVGGELKSTLCLLRCNKACLSEDHGHLSDPANYRRFVATAQNLLAEAGADIDAIACDLHPDYAATRYARTLGYPVHCVQHHHAHVVAAMAEHALTGPVVGIACDGTGYGSDGQIWGCELLRAELADFIRAGQLRYFPLTGGDSAAIETYRPAAGLLAETFGSDWPESVVRRIDPVALRIIRSRLDSDTPPVVRTSSLGRLFDAVAFLLGLCYRNDTEAAAPLALQNAAQRCQAVRPLAYNIEASDNAPLQIDPRAMIQQLITAVESGRNVDELAGAFHETIALALAEACSTICREHGIDKVVLTGGCFVNGLLRNRLMNLLVQKPLTGYIHRDVSCGDAGIALGQAVAVAEKLGSV